MIIDCHTHIASQRIIPSTFVGGMGDNLLSNMPQQLDEEKSDRIRAILNGLMSLDDHCDILVREMDNAGIAKSVLLIIDFAYAFPGGFPDLKAVCDLHREVLAKYPDRFIVFMGIDPRRGEAGLELFEQSVRDWGFRGLKLYPPCGFSPSDEALFPYYELCEQYGLPVLLHTGPTSPNLSFKYSAPELIDDAAFRFPKVQFILAHAAFMHHEQAAILAEYRPNVHLDVSGFTNALRMERFEAILLSHKKRGILNKILFGTDWPIHRLNGNQQELVRLFRQAAERVLTSEELEVIFCKNITRMLNL